MPRYFLNIHDEFVALDYEGVELPDLHAAREEAIHGLRDIIGQEVKNGRVPTYEYIDIKDESGNQLSRITFFDAIQILDKRSTEL